jgi:dienelactone hydrolase
MAKAARSNRESRDIQIHSGAMILNGELAMPNGATGVVLFAHGSGSSRHSPRNQFVARTIRETGVGTLLFDLLSSEEESLDASSGVLRFDISLLARRLRDATRWIQSEFDYLRVGYFGASTGGGAALVAAAQSGEAIGAVVSRGGRPDLAGDFLGRVKSPSLLIVGGRDTPVIQMNQYAYAQLRCEKRLEIVRGATHLFQEPGALEQVARLAADWFRDHLIEKLSTRKTEGV